MAGLIALVGGDEFRPGCESMDEQILKATGVSTPKVVVVPTAAAHSRPDIAAANGASYFNGLGANAQPLMVLDADDANNTDLVTSIDDADIIYLSGGNPSHLLDVLTSSVMLEKIHKALDRGAIVAGSSAGAMVMGTWMRFREWRQALGLSGDVVTLPHHERADSATDPESEPCSRSSSRVPNAAIPWRSSNPASFRSTPRLAPARHAVGWAHDGS